MTRIDRYLLSETMRRLALALAIVLLALVLERVMRLFEFAADNGAAISTVMRMTASLVPHYLGIALPAAFFIAVLLLVARLGDESELDAMMGAGLSVRRLTRPLILAGVMLAGLGVLLHGWVEPYSRYGYRALRHAATHGVWTGSIEAQSFFTPSDELTIYAGDVDLDGRDMTDIFVRQTSDDGQEVVTTAASGRVELNVETGMAEITLRDVVQVVTEPGAAPVTMRMRNFRIDPDVAMDGRAFRARGADHRELTLPELWDKRHDPDADLAGTAAERRSELHGRLARALSILLMPFLAIPMGMAAKRQRKGVAIAFAAVLLVVYRHVLELGGGLVASGAATAIWGYWVPFAGFTLLAFWLYARIDGAPRRNGFDRAFDLMERAWDALMRPFRRRKRRRAAP